MGGVGTGLCDLTGRSALVTGAGSGIGQRVAVGLAEAGADVSCVDLAGQRAGDVHGHWLLRHTSAFVVEVDAGDRVALAHLHGHAPGGEAPMAAASLGSETS